jgi:hypothetical protein
MAQEYEGPSDERFTTLIGKTVFVYDNSALAPGNVPPRRSLSETFKSNDWGVPAEDPYLAEQVSPNKEPSMQERLWSTYGNRDSNAFEDGTQQHEIVQRVKQSRRE